MKLCTRMLCLLLAICMLSFMLVSCGNEETSSTPSTALTSNTSDDSGGGGTFPLEKKDFGDVTLKILTDQTTEFAACEFAPAELTTEPVNDAAYNRATLIAQEYGIKLEQCYAENQNKVIETARELIKTGTDEYQIYCAAIYYLAILSVEDMFVDIANIQSNDYIDLNQPYWDQSIRDDLSILGSTYFVTGDALVSDDEATWAVFFNKQIAEDNSLAADYNASSLYEIVERGDWTLDVMYEMAQKATVTVGGSMDWDPQTEDTWGIVSQCYDSYAFTVGAGQSLTRLENDIPVITIGEEANVKAFDKVFNILTDKTTVAIAEINGAGTSDCYSDMIATFANGKGLFMPYRVGAASMSVMREAQIRYGILPMPKYDTTQDDYSSTVTVYWCSAMAIPTTNVEKFDATCYAMEALAYYGQESVTPEYYDRTLKYKRFPENDESPEMLDLIFRSKSYDIGAVFNFGSMLGFYTSILNTGNNTHISSYDSQKDVFQMAIDEFVDLVQSED